MRLIRIALIGLAIAALAAPRVEAQRPDRAQRQHDGPLPGAQGRGWRAQVFRDLQLDSAQQDRADSVIASYRGRMQELRDGADATHDDSARAKFDALMEEQLAEVRAFLTPDQQSIFDRNVAALREKRRGPRQPGQRP